MICWLPLKNRDRLLRLTVFNYFVAGVSDAAS
jgi:hypothetical protein